MFQPDPFMMANGCNLFVLKSRNISAIVCEAQSDKSVHLVSNLFSSKLN